MTAEEQADVVPPLAFVYLRSDRTPNVGHALKLAREVAALNGFQLETSMVFADSDGSGEHLAALVRAMRRAEGRTVIIPDERHLTTTQRDMLRNFRIGVFAAQPPTCWPAKGVKRRIHPTGRR